jgi:hypothetical protein
LRVTALFWQHGLRGPAKTLKNSGSRAVPAVSAGQTARVRSDIVTVYLRDIQYQMDQIGQKQRAKPANRVKPRPKDGERPRKFPSIATCSAGATPVRQPGAGKVLAGGYWVIRAPVE